MSREQLALLRLVVIAAAWALGSTLVWAVGAPGLDVIVPAVFAVAAYVAIRDMDWGRPRQRRHWRGRPVDDDDERRRWH